MKTLAEAMAEMLQQERDLSAACQQLFAFEQGAKLKRAEVYQALAHATSRIINNNFCNQVSEILHNIGIVKGSAKGYSFFRHISYRSKP